MDQPSEADVRLRLAVAVGIGILSAILVALYWSNQVSVDSDVDQLWAGTRALWHGNDPYAVPLTRERQPFFYPAPALLLVSPIAWLSLPAFRAVFFGIGAAVCVYALTARSWWALTLCTSAAFYYALQGPQWSPLLTGAATTSWGGLALVAKPTLGAALLLAYPSRLRVAGGVVLVLLSFLVAPHWLASWIEAVRRAPHYPLLLVPGGAVLLLALLRWRRPEARLLAALACVPGTGLAYEWVPLWLIPETRRQYLALAVLTDVAFVPTITGPPTGMSIDAFLRWNAILALLLVYLPCLSVVLRRRARTPSARTVSPEAAQ